jgi:tellurite resistance-related uncharacterized protein
VTGGAPDGKLARVQRRITGFHRDEEAHWVAELDCGHARHVRHIPPLSSRPWVLEEVSRAEHLGTPLECVRCDALEWPSDFEAYRRTAIFENATIPEALRKDHATKPGVWARIHVLRGRLRLRMQEPALDEELSPDRDGIIPPQSRHRVEPLGDVAFFVEFHRRAAGRD